MRTLMILLFTFFITACDKGSPPVILETHNGNELGEQQWQGKWVYINYWAEWCKPCAEEIPELNAFAAENPDVLVLGVNFDKPDLTTLLTQVNAMRIDFPVIVNDIQPAFPHQIPSGLPTTLVFNPQGELADTLQGPQTRAMLNQAKNL